MRRVVRLGLAIVPALLILAASLIAGASADSWLLHAELVGTPEPTIATSGILGGGSNVPGLGPSATQTREPTPPILAPTVGGPPGARPSPSTTREPTAPVLVQQPRPLPSLTIAPTVPAGLPPALPGLATPSPPGPTPPRPTLTPAGPPYSLDQIRTVVAELPRATRLPSRSIADSTRGQPITVGGRRIQLPPDAYVDGVVSFVSCDFTRGPCPEAPLYDIARGESRILVSIHSGKIERERYAPGDERAFDFLKDALR